MQGLLSRIEDFGEAIVLRYPGTASQLGEQGSYLCSSEYGILTGVSISLIKVSRDHRLWELQNFQKHLERSS